jgi:hypothetical protein
MLWLGNPSAVHGVPMPYAIAAIREQPDIKYALEAAKYAYLGPGMRLVSPGASISPCRAEDPGSIQPER